MNISYKYVLPAWAVDAILSERYELDSDQLIDLNKFLRSVMTDHGNDGYWDSDGIEADGDLSDMDTIDCIHEEITYNITLTKAEVERYRIMGATL